MFKSIRQSMSWLHSWLGLVFGWIMFVIFLTGTTAYYKNHIDLWAEPTIASTQYEQKNAIKSAYAYLQENVDTADEWYINLATHDKPVNHLFWLGDEGFGSAVLEPQQGEEILLDNEIGLGQFFYLFHFQFHGVDIPLARAIVSLFAFMMLIVLISGIITHKKIFSDFFTLRAFKGQRSWLDVHNLSAVIALPFFLIITLTGLLILFNFYMPQGLTQVYGEKKLTYFTEIREKSLQSINNEESSPAEMQIEPILNYVYQQWGDREIKRIVIKNPNRSNATFYIEQMQDNSLTLRPNSFYFNAVTGEILESNRKNTAIALTSVGSYGLHLAYFAQPFVRLALFFSGILGCVMIASGLLMWSIKRQIQNKGEESIGQYLVDRLNITFILGLPIAMVSAFYSVRLHSLIDPQIVNISFISCFFSFWTMSFTLALLMPQSKLWISQLLILIILCLILPIFNVIYLVSQDMIHHFTDYWLFLRIDLVFIILAILAILFLKNIQPIQNRIKQKIEDKLADDSTNTPIHYDDIGVK